MNVLDFEKPIFALEEKIRKFKENANSDQEYGYTLLQNMISELEHLKNEIYGNLTAWQKIQIARHPDRPHACDYISQIFTDFTELHGDRNIRDDRSMTGGFASLDGKTVMVIGQEKGRTIKEKQYRNFGMNSPEGYRKATRLMKLAEKFNKPVVCFVDTPGPSPGIEAEQRGQAASIARNICEQINLKVPVISVIIGEGASAGALALCAGDRVMMMEYTWYSVVSPEACSSMLWHDWDHNEHAADALKLTAADLFKAGMIDDVIREPAGGAHREPEKCYVSVKEHIIRSLAEVEKTDPAKRIAYRLEKYTQIGYFEEKV